MSSLNYLELCRLCLVKDRVHIGIFEGEGEVRQIFLKIAACLPVKVRKDDRLPKQICDDCLQKVELLYQFWNQTANAEKQLLEWLGETVDDKTVETNVKHEHMEQDAGSELANSLSRVEAVLAEAREHESSDNDHFGDDSHKPETDSDDEPLSSLEPTQFINVNLNGSQSTTAQTQEEFLAPSAPSTSKSNVPAAVAQAAGSGIQKKIKRIRIKRAEFTCQICGRMFSGFYNLRLHALEHNGVRRFTCEHCEYTANHMCQIKQHVKIKHKRDEYKKEHFCEHCGKAFYTKIGKDNHVLNVHNIGEKRYFSCHICSKIFDSRNKYKYHVANNHKDEKKVNCEVCGKLFNESYLRTHEKRVHQTKPKRTTCHICGKEMTLSFLKKHMEFHEGIKNHVCEFCGQCFSLKNTLKIHKYNHTGEKPHKCTFCGKGFKQITLLTQHKKRYHNEGQDCILCDVCEAAFKTKKKFVLHWQRHCY